ncbi:MAG TPA: hypothetical protein VMG12_01540 [Polyangiaceae bacterium]|nr:hypothetical protein [Polyangiaceae bacterium]
MASPNLLLSERTASSGSACCARGLSAPEMMPAFLAESATVALAAAWLGSGLAAPSSECAEAFSTALKAARTSPVAPMRVAARTGRAQALMLRFSPTPGGSCVEANPSLGFSASFSSLRTGCAAAGLGL